MTITIKGFAVNTPYCNSWDDYRDQLSTILIQPARQLGRFYLQNYGD